MVVILGVFTGCAWRNHEDDCIGVKGEAKAGEPPVDCVQKGDLDALNSRVDLLEDRVDANEKAAADAMMTAEKALKCCRKEFITILAEEVNFAFNKYDLDAESKEKLDRVATKLKEDPDYIIEIAGHCDAVGGTDYNIVLGQKRADAVRAYLVDNQHISFSRIAIRSGGETQPIATNDTDDGRSKNRRATISVLGYSLE
jgi:outer membrane protein OmpA-like peptidoglycan-associated protein